LDILLGYILPPATGGFDGYPMPCPPPAARIVSPPVPDRDANIPLRRG
jgi:hypothetical protein